MISVSGRLTQREQEVLDLALTGLADKEVAARLRISDKTVRTHIANALAKFGAANRCQLGYLLAQFHAEEFLSRQRERETWMALEGRFAPADTVLIDVTEGGEVVLTKQEAPELAETST